MSYIFLLFVLYNFGVWCSEIKDPIYYEIPDKAVSHCVRRLNSTSSVGCSSNYSGTVGIIEVAFNETELNSKLNILRENTIFILNLELFLFENITNQLKINHLVQGIVVFDQGNCSDIQCNSFSEDYKVPNQEFSYFINSTYNSAGTEYAFKNWPFPVALIGKDYQSEQLKIIECYKNYNLNMKSNRRCALEIKNVMAATKSGDTCLKYQRIQDRFAGLFQPVYFYEDFSGSNYIVYTKEKIKLRSKKSVITLISRLDSLSMFERSAVSSHGTITSASLLLSVMYLLTSDPEFQAPATNLTKDVLFLFLDNESYDYLGSNRFFLDLKHGNVAKSSGVPINSSHLDLLLEFGELAFSDFSESSFFYPPNLAKAEDMNRTLKYIERLQVYFQKFGFENGVSIPNLPPSSAQYFLRKSQVPTIVMADHENQFKNKFYNSFLDDKKLGNESEEVLVAIVNAVASFVFREATGLNLSRLMDKKDKVTPMKIVECFTENIRCDLLQEVMTAKNINDLHSFGFPIPLQAHSGTKTISSNFRFSYLVRNLIIYLSGQKVNNSICDACPKCQNFTTIKSGNDSTKHCYRTRVTLSDEFSYEDRNGSFWITSTIVGDQSIRIFVKAPNTPLLITGIVITLIVTLFMLLISSKMSEIFQSDD